MTWADFLPLLGAALLAVAFAIVMKWRRRTHSLHLEQTVGDEVCEHLHPALELLRARGHRITRIGQQHPDLPIEIHLAPPFDPRSIYDELKLEEPVFVSERNVLYCKEDWCEIHPKA